MCRPWRATCRLLPHSGPGSRRLLVALVVAPRITAPLSRLLRVARGMAAGQRDIRVGRVHGFRDVRGPAGPGRRSAHFSKAVAPRVCSPTAKAAWRPCPARIGARAVPSGIAVTGPDLAVPCWSPTATCRCGSRSRRPACAPIPARGGGRPGDLHAVAGRRSARPAGLGHHRRDSVTTDHDQRAAVIAAELRQVLAEETGLPALTGLPAQTPLFGGGGWAWTHSRARCCCARSSAATVSTLPPRTSTWIHWKHSAHWRRSSSKGLAVDHQDGYFGV
jgi:hypothetical protein